LNASLDETNVVIHKEINIASPWRSTGAAGACSENADEKNILGIQRTMNDLAERRRFEKSEPRRCRKALSRFTNPGVFADCLMRIINQPKLGILGLGAIENRSRGDQTIRSPIRFDVLRERLATTISRGRRRHSLTSPATG